MFRDGWLLKTEGGDDVADRAFIKGKEGEDFASSRFGNGVERVRSCGSTSHGRNIYPYRNMSRDFFGWNKELKVEGLRDPFVGAKEVRDVGPLRSEQEITALRRHHNTVSIQTPGDRGRAKGISRSGRERVERGEERRRGGCVPG